MTRRRNHSEDREYQKSIEIQALQAHPVGCVCAGCGCTDSQACVDGNGRPCHWIVTDPERGAGLCSVCAGTPLEVLMERREDLFGLDRVSL